MNRQLKTKSRPRCFLCRQTVWEERPLAVRGLVVLLCSSCREKRDWSEKVEEKCLREVKK